MNATAPQLVFGHPPHDLVKISVDARQCSPLAIDSLHLADMPPESAGSAVMLGPPGTLERRYCFARMLTALAVGAPLTALALKDKGGSRIADELRSFGCSVTQDSRKHYRIATTTRPATLHGVEAALEAGGLQQHPAHGLWTQPGIFSWDRIDEGSALLLKYLPPLSGCGADLGAGFGVLSQKVLASPQVTKLTLVELDRRALTAARKNITDPRAEFLWTDMRGGARLHDLDFVVMNPPFHDRGVEDQSLGQTFIARAATMLKPGGQCWVVANRHLPYEEILTGHFTHTRTATQAGAFKILWAER